jgi:hypothetical protein
MKFRLVRLNPLTLAPGEMFVMCGRQMEGLKIVQFPCRLEVWVPTGFAPEAKNDGSWQPVEFVNEFAQPDEDHNAREVRAEVQVPVYNGSSRNKKRGGVPGSG